VPPNCPLPRGHTRVLSWLEAAAAHTSKSSGLRSPFPFTARGAGAAVMMPRDSLCAKLCAGIPFTSRGAPSRQHRQPRPGGTYKASTGNPPADPSCTLTSMPPISPSRKMPHFCTWRGIDFSKGAAVAWQGGIRVEKSPLSAESDTAWKTQLLTAPQQEGARV